MRQRRKNFMIVFGMLKKSDPQKGLNDFERDVLEEMERGFTVDTPVQMSVEGNFIYLCATLSR